MNAKEWGEGKSLEEIKTQIGGSIRTAALNGNNVDIVNSTVRDVQELLEVAIANNNKMLNDKLHEFFDEASEKPEFTHAVEQLANPILFILGHDKK